MGRRRGRSGFERLCSEPEDLKKDIALFEIYAYITTFYWITGATPFCLIHGQELPYPIDLIDAKPYDEVLTEDYFAEWLDEMHTAVREKP